METFFHSHRLVRCFVQSAVRVSLVLAALVLLVSTAQAQSAGPSEPSTSAQSSSSDTSSEEAQYMSQALKRVFSKAERITTSKNKLLAGYGFDREGACLWGTYLDVGKQNTLETTLQAGCSYFFVGAGDDWVKNVDVIITDTKGHILAQDTDVGKEAGVLFKPKYNGLYKVILRLKAGDKFGMCALACLKRPDGWILNKPMFVSMTDAIQGSAEDFWKKFKGGYFLRGGQWSLVMGAVPQGKLLLWRANLPACKLGIILSNDGVARDLDMYLVNAQDKIVASETKAGSTPGLVFDSPNGGGYQWEVRATSTPRPALIMVALIELGNG